MAFLKGNKVNIGRKPWNTGIKRPPFSAETRKKMSEAHKGKTPSYVPSGWNKGMKGCYTLSDETKNKIAAAGVGRVCSEDTRRKRSESLKRAHREGRHASWKGGVSDENNAVRHSIEYRMWRNAVYKRDDYMCQECGQRGKKLNADHIKPFALFKELRFDVDNGRTLCVECHKKTPTYCRKTKV